MNHSSNSTQSATQNRASTHDSGVAKVYHQMEETVEERPLSAVMLSFGLGVGIGIAIGSLIAASTTPAEPHKRAAERMGQQMIDALARMVPNSLSERFS
jgi:hypothetical protein